MAEYPKLSGLRATIIGAAREGTALARFLVACGAQVTLSDMRPATALTEHLSQLSGLALRLELGGNPPEILDTDVVFLSPGVPPYAAIVRQARQRGLPLSSEPRLFTQLCPAPIVGVTGSSGKTTTTALIGEMMRASGHITWVGGNIGQPLITQLLLSECPDIVVMELSSFQLELFGPEFQSPEVMARRSAASRAVSLSGWSPHVAVVTNITPNHLDRHPSMDDYVRAKGNIVRFQKREDYVIVNQDNALSYEMGRHTMAQLRAFSLCEPVEAGAYFDGQQLKMRWDRREEAICARGDLRLRGLHNVANVLAAACAARCAGADLEAIRQVARTFAGVPHRLEEVRRWRGVLFINDSIATSPERAMAAIRSFDAPLVLLAGGKDKNLPWGPWAKLVHRRVKTTIAFGQAVPIIENALAEAAPVAGTTRLISVSSLEEAVAEAARIARPGDVVLLSPGGTSFDAFRDFEARGQRFRELVQALEE